MRVALDLDSTLFPVLEAMSVVPGGSRVSHEACSNWDTLSELCDEDIWVVMRRAMSAEIAARVGLYPGARNTVCDLRQMGVWVEIVTARPEDLIDETVEFLDLVRLPYDSLAIGLDIDKPGHCQSQEIGVLVDDAPHTLEQASAVGIECFGLEHPYNAHLASETICLARDWAELGPWLRRALLGPA